MFVMYYESVETGEERVGSWMPAPRLATDGLPLTPSVALRTLCEQVQEYEGLIESGAVYPGSTVTLASHFAYPLSPPASGERRPIGDLVYDAIADYASKVLSRQGLLSTASNDDPERRARRHVQLTRELFAFEHALAMGLLRLFPDSSLVLREHAARVTLAIAAYWCDRDQLDFCDDGFSHPLLGERPSDTRGQVLFDHAIDALDQPHNLRLPQTEEFLDLREAVVAGVHAHLAQRAVNE